MWAQRKATPLTPLSPARDQKGSNLTARKNTFGSAKTVRHREPMSKTSTLSRSSTTVATQTGYIAEVRFELHLHFLFNCESRPNHLRASVYCTRTF
jgi:hypothetical protein